ncbi:Isoprenyl transferase [Desulfonema magnum]|uniref:Isoprenyl transferase n=2 Tax=Desulfonema magnum TaxID=45655 RepID=A0A975BNW2_9BACT|nr:Isoprenyl transferase [Desulfonema magnum]
MDGNGRWAKKRLANRVRGHEQGMDVVRKIVRAAREMGISVLTLYAFSTENWQRPKLEVSALMALLKKFLKSELREMMDNNIRLNAIGQTERLPDGVRDLLYETIHTTEKNEGMLLNLALSYGGRAEIVRMVQDIARKAKQGEIDPDAVTPELVADHLYTRGMTDPDLLIRTSGEMRISNFLLWQIAYSEIYITNTLWPDFGKEEFIQILKAYQQRERRFGKV